MRRCSYLPLPLSSLDLPSALGLGPAPATTSGFLPAAARLKPKRPSSQSSGFRVGAEGFWVQAGDLYVACGRKIFTHPLYEENVVHDYDFALLKPLGRVSTLLCCMYAPEDRRWCSLEVWCPKASRSILQLLRNQRVFGETSSG